MKSRSDYMAGRISHEDYYAQMVNERVLRYVSDRIGVEAIKLSQDEHFNDIPLAHWDSMAQQIPGMVTLPDGESMTLSTVVCIAKSAARLIKAGKTV